ncbi:unnamed protein product, partial [Polarella glacialis]
MASSSAARPIIESDQIVKVKHSDGTKTINGFLVKELLGSGTFAKVKRCEQESSADEFAIKVFRKLRLRKQREYTGGGGGGGMKVRTALDKVYDEIQVMRTVVDPYCIRLYAVFDDPAPAGKIYLVIEYAARGPTMDCEADRCVYFVPDTKGSSLGEDVAKSYVSDTLRGLRYLHGCSIAHRDIKPQNLLVDADGYVKVADFTVSIRMDEDFQVVGTEGTYTFFSPEMCKSGYKGHDGRRADVWAAGVSLWAFLYGSVPFFEADLVRLLDSIAEAKYELPPVQFESPECLAFLARLLTPEPLDRPLVEDMLRDAWCTEGRGAGGGAGRPEFAPSG